MLVSSGCFPFFRILLCQTPLCAGISQNFFQSIFTARMAPYHIGIASSCFFHCAPHHLMRYCICKQHDQIRAADLFAKTRRHLGEYFCLAIELLTDLFILTYHSVMTAYDNNTHKTNSSFLCKYPKRLALANFF